MGTVLRGLAILLFLSFGHIKSTAQHSYDFDSLLKHNPYYEPVLRAVADTFKLFEDQYPLEFTVSTDLKALAKNKYKDVYQEATVKYQIADTLAITRKVRIKPRGEFRLKNCRYAPLRVNVKETTEIFELLDDLDKIKLVVPCRGLNVHQNYVFNEFLAYKLYNVLTDYSFRVRLIKVDFHDTSGKQEPQSIHTFIIESHKNLAKRTDAFPYELEKASAKHAQEEHAVMMYLFNLMIGNTDYSISGGHNIKLLKSKDPTIPLLIPVPYDFDYCGLVDATYAIPGDHVSIKEVTEREYLGYCTSEEALTKGVQTFLEKKEDILNVARNFQWLDEKGRKKSIRFLEEFYWILEDPKKIDFRIRKACRESK